MPDFGREAELWAAGYRHVAGVDEAGRGPLAGPVVVAAVILPRDWMEATAAERPALPRLDDSKRLSPGAREVLYAVIRRRALAWRVRVMAAETIDRVNILQATLQGMAHALAALRPAADYALVDGNRLPALGELPAEPVVKGDGRCCTIAAASILAKVVRDRLMRVYARRYPHWGFAQHKGYPTAAHLAALREHGPSPIHRRSFRAKGVPWQEKCGQEVPVQERHRQEVHRQERRRQERRGSAAPENPSLPGIWSG